MVSSKIPKRENCHSKNVVASLLLVLLSTFGVLSCGPSKDSFEDLEKRHAKLANELNVERARIDNANKNLIADNVIVLIPTPKGRPEYFIGRAFFIDIENHKNTDLQLISVSLEGYFERDRLEKDNKEPEIFGLALVPNKNTSISRTDIITALTNPQIEFKCNSDTYAPQLQCDFSTIEFRYKGPSPF